MRQAAQRQASLLPSSQPPQPQGMQEQVRLTKQACQVLCAPKQALLDLLTELNWRVGAHLQACVRGQPRQKSDAGTSTCFSLLSIRVGLVMLCCNA